MPTPKGISKSSPILRRGFKSEAEKTALRYRSEIGIAAHSPLPAANLAEHLGISIMTPDEIKGISDEFLNLLLTAPGKDAWSAAIFLKNDKKFIIHNPTHSLARQESNLMHELAHASCNHELCEMETALSGLVIPLRKYDHVQEAEAECLGGCLQLPQKALYHYHHILHKSSDEIAEEFTASKQMVNYRLGITGVLKIRRR
jgi:Zn-dependent peptidase ImmA (M78 family)